MNSGFGQSCRGYYLLTMLGYPKIKVLHGGYDAWAAAGLPTTTDVPSPVKASFSIVPEAGDILIDAKTMLAALGKPGIALLDVRDVDEWIGESSSPYGKDFCPRKGRIPGAVWLEWYRMMKPTAEGRASSPRTRFWRNAPPSAFPQTTPVYLYCFKGARASNTFLALKNAGVKDVRMYFGSWNEWSRDPSLPIDEGLPTDAKLNRQSGIKRACSSPAGLQRPGGDLSPDGSGGTSAVAMWQGGGMSIFDDPFDAERELTRPAASAASIAPQPSMKRRRWRCAASLSPNEEKRYEGVVASAVVRAMFPKDAARRAFLKSVGASTALAAISQFFPIKTATEAFADAGTPEKKDLKVGFIPITCATPIIMAAPLGFYSKHGLNVEVVKTAGWAVIRDKTINKEYDAAHMLAPMPIAISLGLGATRSRSRCPRSRTSTGRASRLP